MSKKWAVLVLLGMAVLVPPTPEMSESLKLQQQTLTVTYNSTSITIFPNETKVIEANVSFGGTPVNDAIFYLKDLTGYDLGEAAILISPGFYQVVFRNYSNLQIPPDNYSTELVVESDEFNANASTPFTFNLIRTDVTAPLLTVYQPVGNQSYTDLLPVNFTARDDVGWRLVEVSFQGVVIFSRLYVGQDSPTPNFFWNKTHIQIATFIRVHPIDGDSTIRISVWDTSFNVAEYTTEAADDLKAPSIQILKPFDGEVLEDRNIVVEWAVEDKSGVSRVEILINGIAYQDVTGQNRVELLLPIEEGMPRNLTLAIRALDLFNNTAVVTIRLEYNPGKFATDKNLVDQIFRPNLGRDVINLILVMATVTFLALLVLVYVLMIRKPIEEDEMEQKLKGRWQGRIINPPFLQILRTITDADTGNFREALEFFYGLEKEWEEIHASLSSKRKLKREVLANSVAEFSEYILNQIGDKFPQAKPSAERLLDKWKDYFNTFPRPAPVQHINSMTEKFPKNTLMELLQTHGVLNTRLEDLLTIFEEEWKESIQELSDTHSSIDELLAFRGEFVAELYLALTFLLNYDTRISKQLDRAINAIG